MESASIEREENKNSEKIITELLHSDYIKITKKRPKNKESLPIVNIITKKTEYELPIKIKRK